MAAGTPLEFLRVAEARMAAINTAYADGERARRMIERPSPNFDVRTAAISMIVLHYTGMQSAAAALDRLANPAAKVSAHYVVAEDGVVVRMVDDANRAWHAGRSWWRGITDVNSASVGIEIVNPGHEFGYRPFPEPQMAAVEALVGDIARRYAVSPAMVVGHSDIAPARKDDPGELFDWPRLARAGLADRIPSALTDPNWTDSGFFDALGRYGYDVTDPTAAIIAFQRHFRPSDIGGSVDAECRAIVLQLLRQHL